MEPQPRAIKVFIAENSASIRVRLIDMLLETDGVQIVGTAASLSNALQHIAKSQPDFVVLDFQLIGGTALQVLKALHPPLPHTTFIILTDHCEPQYRRVRLEAGASYFFDKASEFARVRSVIELASRATRTEKGIV